MKTVIALFFAAALVVVTPAVSRAQESDSSVVPGVPVDGPINVADEFVHAQADFDVKALTELTEEQYLEISPLGDIDPREKMLSFYAPEHKVAGVKVSLKVDAVRNLGDSAVVIGIIDFTYPGKDGKSVSNSMRGTFFERKHNGIWRLVSTEFTPSRPATK